MLLWCPFYTPISAVSSWGWWLHATSASGRRAPATEHIWMPKSTLVGLIIIVKVVRFVSQGSDGVTQGNVWYIGILH
jgi:hypothetical protein